MLVKTIQWNIGGGKIRQSDDDPMDPLVYCHDSLEKIIEVLKKYNSDIITIQESHTNKTVSQAKTIAAALGFKYFINDVYDKSHLEENQGLSQTIISRFPIKKHVFTFFHNPKLQTVGPKGEHWNSHEKGVSSCLIKLNEDLIINVKTSHSFSHRRFNIEPLSEVTLELRNDMTKKLQPESNLYIYQGDLNFNEFSIKSFLPNILINGVEEVVLNEPTTPKGRKYDHILYKNIKHLKSVVISDLLTDHFPIYSEFLINHN